MDVVSPETDAYKPGLPDQRVPPKCQESVMPKLNFGVFLQELVMEEGQISDT
jgi:hypothetical protein